MARTAVSFVCCQPVVPYYKMKTMRSLDDWEKTGMAAVRSAGAQLRDRFGRQLQISAKQHLELVTDADHAAEQAAVQVLQQQTPGAAILSEECGALAGSSDACWILDPLDGTTNFAHAYPFFCVSLGLQLAGSVAWGAVYDPLRDELFHARRGGGAWCNGQPIRVSDTARLDDALLCTGFPYDIRLSPDTPLKLFRAVTLQARGIRRDGAAALDLCYVAMGRFDGFWEQKLQPWDMAAGQLMVTAAGGCVSGLTGDAFDLNGAAIVAANPAVFFRIFGKYEFHINSCAAWGCIRRAYRSGCKDS